MTKLLEQMPDKRIIWRSKGAKGYVDGAVTFHEIAPELTRILLVLEYHPQLHMALRQEIDAWDDQGEHYHFTGEAIASAPMPAWPNVSRVTCKTSVNFQSKPRP